MGGGGRVGVGSVAHPFICVALLSFTSESFIFKQAVFFLLTVRVCTEEQMVAVGGCCRLNRQSRVGCRELLPLWRDEGIGGWGGGGGVNEGGGGDCDNVSLFLMAPSLYRSGRGGAGLIDRGGTEEMITDT